MNEKFLLTMVVKNSAGEYKFRLGSTESMEYDPDIPLDLLLPSKLEGHDYENHIVWLAHIDMVENGRNKVRLIYSIGFTLDTALNDPIVKCLQANQMFADFAGINDDSSRNDPFLDEVISLILAEAPMRDVNALIKKGHEAIIHKNSRLWEYQRAKKLDIDKLVFCRFEKSKDHKGYRAYLRSMDTVADFLHREGWWNTYSYFPGDRLIDHPTNLDCSNDEQAIWLASIVDVKQDKFGYTNFILEPLTIVASEVTGIQNTPALGYLQCANLFSRNYRFDLPSKEYNYDRILEGMVKLIPNLRTDESPGEEVVDQIRKGRLSIDDLNRWATTPTRYEALAECWQIQDDMPMLYPHTARHINSRKSGDAFVVRILEEFFYDWELTIYVNTEKGMRFDETADDLARLLESWWAEKDEDYDRRAIKKAKRKARRAAREKKGKGVPELCDFSGVDIRNGNPTKIKY